MASQGARRMGGATKENERSETENKVTRPGKQIIEPSTLLIRRPALGEVGNKIKTINQRIDAIKKQTVIKDSELLKKSAIGPVKKHTTTAPLIAAGKPNPPHLFRQESTYTRLLKKPISIPNPEPGYCLNLPIGVTDVDSTESDPMLVAEYIKDIMSHLLDLETKYAIKENFLEAHKSTHRIRAVLINWLSEVNTNFKFVSETFHLCVAIVDRYLQVNKNIGRETLQLVGTVALLIAGKYEELFIPDLQDYVYICDDEFTRGQMLRMECDILKTLKFSLGRPLSLHFLRRYNKIAMVTPAHHSLGKYILELALQEYELCHIKPSLQAAAACFLSISVLNEQMDPTLVWTQTLIYYSTYSYADIKKTVIEFAGALVKAETSKHQAIRKKYATPTFAKISVNPKLKGPLITKLSKQSKILKK